MLQLIVRRFLLCCAADDPMQAIRSLETSLSRQSDWRAEWFPRLNERNEVVWLGIESWAPMLHRESVLAKAIAARQPAIPCGSEWLKWLPQEVWRAELKKTYKQLSERTFRSMRNGKHASICIRCHPDSKNSNLSMHLDDLRKLGYEGD